MTHGCMFHGLFPAHYKNMVELGNKTKKYSNINKPWWLYKKTFYISKLLVLEVQSGINILLFNTVNLF